MIGCKNSAIVRDWLRLSENATPSSGGKCPHPVPGAPGSGGKCTKFAAIWFTFPGKKGEMAVKSTFSARKCTKKAGKWFTSPLRQNADTSPVSKKREGVILRISIFFLQHLYTKLKFLPRIQAELYNENSNVKPWTLSRSDNERSILGEQGFRHFVSHAIGSPLDEGTNPFSFLFPI